MLWHREMGEGYATVAVADGRVFLFDRHGDRARLTALEEANGREIWRSEYPTAYEDLFDFSNGPRATPLVDGERVYTFGSEGRLRCHRAADGRLLWEVDTAQRYGVIQNFFGAASAPLVEGDLLIVAVGGSPPDSPGLQSGETVGNGSAVVAFDKRTGEEAYLGGDELASYSSPVVATLDGKRWGFYLARGGLLAFDPATGRQRFHFPWRAKKLYSVNAATPLVVGDRVFLSESYGPGAVLLRVDGEGYEVVWKDRPRQQSLASHWPTPVHHQGYLYGASGENSGNAELRCVELATGKVMWKKRGFGRASLTFADGALIVQGEYGNLAWVEATPEGYRPLAEVKLRDPEIRHPAWSAPVLANGRLYLRGGDRLVVLDLRPPAAKTTPPGEAVPPAPAERPGPR